MLAVLGQVFLVFMVIGFLNKNYEPSDHWEDLEIWKD